MSVSFSRQEPAARAFRLLTESNAGKKGKCKQYGQRCVRVYPGATSGSGTAKPVETVGAARLRPRAGEVETGCRENPVASRLPSSFGLSRHPTGSTTSPVRACSRAGDLVPVASLPGKKKAPSTRPDWARLLDQAPKYVFLGMIRADGLRWGCPPGSASRGGRSCRTGFWLLYWAAGYAVLLGLVVGGVPRGAAWASR